MYFTEYRKLVCTMAYGSAAKFAMIVSLYPYGKVKTQTIADLEDTLAHRMYSYEELKRFNLL